MKKLTKNTIVLGVVILIHNIGIAQKKHALLPNGWHVYDMKRPQPVKVTSGKTDSDAPSDAIILFDGTNFDEWEGSKGSQSKWKLGNGFMEITKGSKSIHTRRAFGNMQLHIEWATPEKIEYKGRKRGNSGIYLMGLYEIQIMDAWENSTSADAMAGAVYGQNPALVNVSKRPGEWQSYDIIFKAPVFKEGKLVSPAYVTVLQNGVLIHNNTEIYGPTHHTGVLPYQKSEEKLPLMLQNHGSPNRFRNIWVREL